MTDWIDAGLDKWTRADTARSQQDRTAAENEQRRKSELKAFMDKLGQSAVALVQQLNIRAETKGAALRLHCQAKPSGGFYLTQSAPVTGDHLYAQLDEHGEIVCSMSTTKRHADGSAQQELSKISARSTLGVQGLQVTVADRLAGSPEDLAGYLINRFAFERQA